MSIVINGVPFDKLPNVPYKRDYMAIAKDIIEKKLDERTAYRTMVLDDLFFVLYFIVKPFSPGNELTVNHPWVVNMVREVEAGPKDYTLDVYAREHFKSSVINISETIQYILKNPEHSIGIFSYARPVAKKFLMSIKGIFQSSELLRICFPDIVFRDCEKDSPLWALDDGLVLRRKSNRKEPSISAWGLVEGMPTGLHFDHRIYDDIVTEDIADSIDTMEKVKEKFDSSQNLGTAEGTHRVIGTFYHHEDPLVYIKDKKDVETGQKKYLLRLKPATDNGLATGKPVLLSQKRLNDLKITRTFNQQQLCDPTPQGSRKLDSSMLIETPPEFIPQNLYKFMVIDPAGDSKDNKGDSWAIMVIGVNPKPDEIGASDIYITDALIAPMPTTEAIEEAARMYLRGGMILRVGIEKVGQSTMEIHLTDILARKGRKISEHNKTLILLRPAGRNKVDRIEAALSWPLSNGKIHISTEVSRQYIKRIRDEMDKFPYWRDDALDALAYFYLDVIRDYRFSSRYEETEEIPPNLAKLNDVSRNYWLAQKKLKEKTDNWIEDFVS